MSDLVNDLKERVFMAATCVFASEDGALRFFMRLDAFDAVFADFAIEHPTLCDCDETCCPVRKGA